MGESLLKILNYKGEMRDIASLVFLRDNIKEFKKTNWNLVEEFRANQEYYYNKHQNPHSYLTYSPLVIRKEGPHSEISERRNVGLFSTAICLESLLLYIEEIGGEHQISDLFKESEAISLFNFIVRGLSHRLFKNKKNGACEDEENDLPATQPALVSRVNILNRFRGFYENYKEVFQNNSSCEKEIPYLRYVIADIFVEFYDTIYHNIENCHPYIYYNFIRFLKRWEDLIGQSFDFKSNRLKKKGAEKFISKHFDVDKEESLNQFLNIIKSTNHKKYKSIFFEKIYTHAKYELYRQISLNLSGDMALYDVKRLIYALLTVYVDDKFSNHLIRNKALALIFEPIKEDSNSLWPTGQLIHISKDATDSISVVECAYDLLEKRSALELYKKISTFLPELTNMFFTVLRTAQLKDHEKKGKKLKGWYSLSQRDKTETSWISALTMLFIKRYCKLLSFEITKRAQEFFKLNYRTANIQWDDLYDGTAVKSKLRRMFEIEEKDGLNVKYKTAMFFGPPGTGKTTLARALATKLTWRYLELTPGDFYAGGEREVLPRINEIFKNLQNLKKTVIFIDEIDDLVIKRTPEVYDPRSLYVNTLLPRFQDIHDKGDVILIASTNHIENVDKAISRLGRFDLIIPVGYMSIHGRISLFFNKFSNYYSSDIIRNTVGSEKNTSKIIREFIETNGFELLKKFVEKTKGYTFIQVNKFISVLIDSLAEGNTELQVDSVISKMEALTEKAIEFQKTKIEPSASTRQIRITTIGENKKKPKPTSIRPFDENDFYDLPDSKSPNLDPLIKKTTRLYCLLLLLTKKEKHQMADDILKQIEGLQKESIGKLFDDIYNFDLSDKTVCRYALITPFFDSLETIVAEKEYSDNEIQTCYDKLKNIIYSRPIL